MKTLVLVIISILLFGCATESFKQAREQALVGTSAMIGPDRGVIFGERCGGGGFILGKAHDSSFELVPGWTDSQRYFFVSLPPGTYTLAWIGSTDGAFRGNPPYEFEVKAGKAVYVGAFYPSWWRAGGENDRCKNDWSRSVDTKIYRWETRFGVVRDWEVYLLNQPQVAVAGIRANFPATDLSTHVVQLAK